jgi:hypothetical protein
MTLSTLFRKKPRNAPARLEDACPHSEVAPRWDSAADIGHMDRVTRYICTSCGATVPPR